MNVQSTTPRANIGVTRTGRAHWTRTIPCEESFRPTALHAIHHNPRLACIIDH